MAMSGKTLTVYLAADVSKLKRGVGEADMTLSGFGKKLSGMIGPALIGAAAAAGTFAVAMAVDGVQAAAQEEAELTKLNTTLTNLGFGAASDDINKFIDDLQFTTGVADSNLRPAFERLVTSTHDVTQSQKLLQLALDVSAGTGKDLEAVTNALGKAFDGNLGALGKLGAGIEASTIKSKDLDGALAQLSSTFDGQSAKAAGTLQGQLKILSVSFDELKESFGTGFLSGLQNASGGIQNVSQEMRNLQGAASGLGKFAGGAASTGISFFGSLLGGLTAPGGVLWTFGKLLGIDTAAVDTNTAAIQANSGSLINMMDLRAGMDKYVTGGYSGIPSQTSFNSMDTWLQKIRDIKVSTGTSARATGSLTAAVEKMSPALRAQIDLVKSLTSQLDEAGKKLETARKAMSDWQQGMADQISSGIDLGAINTAAFNDAGVRTATDLVAAFQAQVDQAQWFGNILNYIDGQGGHDLVQALADLGPEAGGRLGQTIINEGLITAFESRLDQIKSTARTAANAMTPEFLVAGVNSAIQFLTGTQNELAAATSVLEEMGAAVGKTIGEAAAKEIADAISAALTAMGGASDSVAGAPAGTSASLMGITAANGGAYASAMSSTAVAQAIAQAITDSNQRLGRTGQSVLQ
jgi:hypothetical protein